MDTKMGVHAPQFGHTSRRNRTISGSVSGYNPETTTASVQGPVGSLKTHPRVRLTGEKFLKYDVVMFLVFPGRLQWEGRKGFWNGTQYVLLPIVEPPVSKKPEQISRPLLERPPVRRPKAIVEAEVKLDGLQGPMAAGKRGGGKDAPPLPPTEGHRTNVPGQGPAKGSGGQKTPTSATNPARSAKNDRKAKQRKGKR